MSRPGRPGADTLLVRRTARRLGLQAAAGTALVVALLAGVTAVVLVRGQSTTADTTLVETVAHVDDVNDPPPGMWLAIRADDGRLEQTEGMPAGLPIGDALDRVGAGGPTETVDVTLGRRDYRVRTELRDLPTGGRAAVQAALDLGAAQVQLASLLRALLIGGLVGLGLAAVIGSWLARRAVRPLETALGLQRRFVADASHELRTPLTLLSTRAQLLRRRLRGGRVGVEQIQADVDGVVADAERLTAILDDLLLAADPRGTVPNEQVELAALAQEVVAAATPAAATARIAISADTRPAVQPPATGAPGAGRVAGSAAGLRRALTALIDNAVRHAASTVCVRVRDTPSAVTVEVIDDGPGIDQQMLPRLFERFASTGDGHGVGPRRYGLGLALVSEIVDRHGGAVSAANTAAGTVFRLELPRAPH